MADDIVKNLTAQIPRHLTTQASIITRGLQEISNHLAEDTVQRAFKLFQERQLEEAIAICTHGIEIASNNEITWQAHSLWQIHGVCLGEQGKYTEALISIDRALNLDSENPYCWSIKSSLLAKSGRYSDAIACDERSINLDPENPRFRENRKSHFAKLKKMEISDRGDTPNIKFEELNIVVTLGVWWFERTEPFPGKMYVMFECDVENNSDVPFRIGKELGLYQRAKATEKLRYIGNAVLLPFSPDLELEPQSSDHLSLEMELTCPQNETPEEYVREFLGDSHNLFGFDHKFEVAILFSEARELEV